MAKTFLHGVSVALPSAAAFAAAGDDQHPDHPDTWQAPQVVLQTEPPDGGRVAGSGETRPYGPYVEQRYDNQGQ